MAFDFASAAQPVLKVVYLPALQELVNNATVFSRQIEKRVVPVEGKTFTIAIHRSRNSGAAVAFDEDEQLVTAGQQGYANAVYPIRQLATRVRVTGKVIAATKSNKGSFLRALDAEMQYAMKDTARGFNRQYLGDGTGALAYWTAADDTSGTNVHDGFGNGTTHLGVGSLTADVIDASSTGHTTVLKQDIVVTRGAVGTSSTAITWTGGDVTGSAGSTTYSSTSDYLVIANTGGKEMCGIQAIVNDADPARETDGLGDLPVSTYADWKAVVMGDDASKQDLTFPLIQQLLARIVTESDATRQDIKFFLCHPAMEATYIKLCQDERTFFNNMKLDGGYEAVSYSGTPFIVDVQARRNALYAIAPESIKVLQLQPLDWVDKDGSVFYRIGGGDYDSYGATAIAYQELACLARNQNGVIKGLNEVWT